MHATLHEVHLRAVAATVVVQDVGKHAYLIITAIHYSNTYFLLQKPGSFGNNVIVQN